MAANNTDLISEIDTWLESLHGVGENKPIKMVDQRSALALTCTLQRAREALTWRERAICFMASSLLEQAETREPVIGAKGDMVFKTLGILAARNFEEAKAPVYFETIADTLTEIARAYTPEEK